MTAPAAPDVFSGVLVCSDIDGTLGECGQIPAVNQAAVRRFQRLGGRFTVATGRHPRYMRELVPAFVANAPLIAINGAVVYDLPGEQVLFSAPLDMARAQALVRQVAAGFPGLKSINYSALHHTLWFSAAEAAALPDDWQVEGGPDGRVRKIIFYGHEPGIVSRLLAWLCPEGAPPPPAAAGFAFGRSSPWGLEMNDAAAGKAKAAEWLRRRLGARLLVALGNEENDAEMLRAADFSYAMANSGPAALAAAACRAPAGHMEGGVAWALADLERRLRAGEL